MDFDENIKIDWATFTGILMVLVGLSFGAVSAAAIMPNTALNNLLASYTPAWTFTLLSDLGVGLVAAGILTFT